MASKPQKPGLPVLALLAGATLWGVVWYPMRLLEQAGLSGLWLTLDLYIVATCAGLVLAWRHRHWLTRSPVLLLALAVTGGWTNLAFILAILDGNVMRVLLLFYLAPVWALIFGWLFLKEEIGGSTLGILVVALVGAVMMLWQGDNPWPWPRDSADWLALSSGFAFAASNVFVRYGQEIPVPVKSLVTWIGVVAMAAVLLIWNQATVPEVTMSALAGVAALGLFGMVTMTMLVQFGVSHMPVHRSAIILLFELVAGAISQQLLTDEVMTWMEWGGGGLVVVAAVLTALRERSSV